METKNQIRPLVAWSLIGALVLVIVIIRMAISNQWEFPYSKNKSPSVSKSETVVMLDFGNGKIRRFKGPVSEQMNAWGALQQAAATGSIKVEIENNFLPVSIDGYDNQENGKYWNLYLNNVKQDSNPSQIQIKAGDEIVFRYE